MELISKLNYDTCQIIENYSSVYVNYQDNLKRYYGNNNNHIMFRLQSITFIKIIGYHIIEYSYYKIKNKFQKHCNYRISYLKPRNEKKYVFSIKDLFLIIDGVPSTFYPYTYYPNNSKICPDELLEYTNYLPSVIETKDLKKMCIGFLFNENFKF